VTDGTAAPERMVSNGHLPRPDRIAALVTEAWRRFRADGSGAPSTVYPALSAVDPALFGICVTAVTGQVHTVGDCDVPFTIMSCTRPRATGCTASGCRRRAGSAAGS
jgi:glutaminase